ncbi:MAG: maleylpyruvate isomerase family mycothiol-dependent enzyme [Acidimicrobiales bacterium]
MPRQEVVHGLTDEMVRFEDLLRSVDGGQWHTPTRCEGWTVADVAAHYVGTLADISAGRFDGLGTPAVTAREVDERRGRSQHELADELHQVAKVGTDIMSAIDEEAWAGPAPGDLGIAMGEGVEGMWYDAYVHGEDIRAALGRPPEPGPGLRASVSHVADLLTQRAWGPATLALDGLEEFPVSGGGAQRVTGDPLRFVEVATGRRDPRELGLDEHVNVYRD